LSVGSGASVELEMPVIGQLLRRPMKAGKLILFLFDPDSNWSTLLLNIVAELLQKGTDVLYVVTSRKLSDIRDDLRRRGVDPATYEGGEHLVLSDGYTLKTGRPSAEKYSLPSLNAADLSILSSKSLDEWPMGSVRIFENVSEIAEASEERSFLKFYRTWTSRLVSNGRFVLDGFVRGIHSDSLYNSVMASADGVFELRTEEVDGKLESALRARSYKGGPVDTAKYVLRLDDNLRVALEPAMKEAR
jgi:KaiC/GvpD/RAD55 family RecA-like ATPase